MKRNAADGLFAKPSALSFVSNRGAKLE
jgi:hypothetical protein